jgi:acyl-CoA synthetase (AMP-forming)/AMP-acid ligase II
VAVSLGNNWEFAVTTYALFKLGAILVSVSVTEVLVTSTKKRF